MPSSSLSSCPAPEGGPRRGNLSAGKSTGGRAANSAGGRTNRGARPPGLPIESSWRRFPLRLPQALENLPIRTCGLPGTHSELSTL